MIISGGKYRSRRIKYNKSSTTRPTANIVREAVFMMLYDVSKGLVLDLFAGSGAYGFEALSRGAGFVYFNDIDNRNVKIIKENITLLQEDSNTEVSNLDYRKAISRYLTLKLKFDFIFIDPPYYQNYYQEVIPQLKNLLNESGRAIIELDKKIEVLESLEDFKIIKDKAYGRKRILIIELK